MLSIVAWIDEVSELFMLLPFLVSYGFRTVTKINPQNKVPGLFFFFLAFSIEELFYLLYFAE